MALADAQHELRQLELEALQQDELLRQRRKQREFETQMKVLLKAHEERQQHKAEELEKLVLQNRMSRLEQQRILEEGEEELHAQQVAIELRIQQLDYDRRVWEKKKNEKEQARLQWVEEEETHRQMWHTDELQDKRERINLEIERRRQKEELWEKKKQLIRLEIEARQLAESAALAAGD